MFFKYYKHPLIQKIETDILCFSYLESQVMLNSFKIMHYVNIFIYKYTELNLKTLFCILDSKPTNRLYDLYF